MKDSPQHILITGAAGARGAALARAFRRHHPDARLTLVDQDGDNLAPVAGELDAVASVCDLTDLEALETWWSSLAAEGGDPDLLINCAGIMDIFTFQGTGWERGRKLLDINFNAPMRLMDFAVPAMVANGRGWVINVTSMAGRVALRGCSYYGGAKAGMGMASEVARLDLRDQGVAVLTVYPGPIWSGLERHARNQVRPGLLQRHIPTGHPEGLARRVHKAFRNGRARVIYPDTYAPARYLANLNLTYRTVDLLGPRPNQ